MSTPSLNFLCVSRFFKGNDFLTACKAAGNRVYLLTSSQHKQEPWAWEDIEEVFYMDEDADGNWNMDHVIKGLAFKMRSLRFDRLVSLDDFDVENTARLREYFRIPGMGDTTARYFRDKLAMRIKAQEAGIRVPAFTSLFHDADIQAYVERVPAPWLIKPRSAASARGIQKIHSAEALWAALDQLGDQRDRHLLEQFAPGDVYHVDGLNLGGKVIFARTSQYLDTPFDVSHSGGIFRSHTVAFGSEDDKALRKMNEQVMKAFGMQYSASHTEFIRGKADGQYYFLETSSRVGGANLAEMVEVSSGINLWGEWARIESAIARGETYQLPKVRKDHAGIVVSLSRYAHPDTSSFTDPEICWRMNKKWHIGLIVQSPSRERILELLAGYTERIAREYHASLPAEEAPRG
jgi:biotin carboxylase